MNDNEIIRLKARVEYLERANSWYFFALERLTSFGDLHKDVQQFRESGYLFANAEKYLKQLIGFHTLAFFEVDERSSQFVLKDCHPESDLDKIQKVTDEQIENGSFAWALKKNRPLIVEGETPDDHFIFHALATKSRVRGMFCGWLNQKANKIPVEHLNLISVILSFTAYAVESGTLYKIVSRQNLNLEEMVAKRTLKLETQAQELKKEIGERKKVAEELNRSNQDLQDFASIASHDLQEPLRKVIIFGDRLKEKFAGKMDESALNYLERMISASARMQNLIDELLSFSRVSTKAKPFESTDLNKVVDGVLTDLDSRIAKSKAKIELDGLPTIDADPVQMQQLFQNLVGNALKFCREGVAPVVSIGGNLNGGGTCEIRVQDNGIGLDKKYVDRIFKPFERLHGRSEFEGTGMGLAICQKIVKRHRGTIEVESTDNKGCTFIIHLPAKQVPA